MLVRPGNVFTSRQYRLPSDDNMKSARDMSRSFNTRCVSVALARTAAVVSVGKSAGKMSRVIPGVYLHS